MKKLRYLFITLAGLFFYSLFLATSIRNIYLSEDRGVGRLGILAKPLEFMAEAPLFFKQYLDLPEYYVKNNQSIDGFNYLQKIDLEQYPKILTTYKLEGFGQKFDLLDIKNGELIKRWEPDNKELFNKGYNKNNPNNPSKGSDLYFMHPFMTNDSSLVFTSQLTSLLAKIDKNSELVWLKNDKVYHHTIEPDSIGNLYVCSRSFESGKYDFLPGEFDS